MSIHPVRNLDEILYAGLAAAAVDDAWVNREEEVMAGHVTVATVRLMGRTIRLHVVVVIA